MLNTYTMKDSDYCGENDNRNSTSLEDILKQHEDFNNIFHKKNTVGFVSQECFPILSGNQFWCK